MSINIEIEYIKRIERENEELKNDLLSAEAMEDYWNINSSELEEKMDNLRQDLQKRCNRCIELNDENKNLKKEIDKQKYYNMSHAQRISELKKKNNKVNEINVDLYKKVKKQDDEISKLSDELTLKIRHNHIQTLEINELKQELFNLYLKHYNSLLM